MKALAVAIALAVAFVAAGQAAAQDPGDTTAVTISSLRIAARTTLLLEVRAPADAIVEVDPTAESWGGVEVVRWVSLGIEGSSAEAVHRFEVVVAPFAIGAISVEPSVAVVTSDGAAVRTLPAVRLEVRPTLAADAPLELSPLPPPGSIGGAESPLLRPALVVAAVAAFAALGTALFFGLQLVRRLMARREPPAEAPAPVPAGFDAIEELIDADPVSAYRSLAAMVRGEIARRFGLPATALTTSELRARMESSGSDRFLARLVGGFLEECDAVVYAGYRPAAERRRADLTMAREIVEGAP